MGEKKEKQTSKIYTSIDDTEGGTSNWTLECVVKEEGKVITAFLYWSLHLTCNKHTSHHLIFSNKEKKNLRNIGTDFLK